MMNRSSLAYLLGLVALTNAHVRLQFPPPRGPFDAPKEVSFCDGYNTVTNRSTFPLEGFLTLKTGHAPWTAGIVVSTNQNPTSFNDFEQLVPFSKSEQAGEFCIPLAFTKTANGTTFHDGQNVTIQIVFEGGDGQLYQCADLTLSSSFKIGSDITCANTTLAASSTSTAPAGATQTAGTVGRGVSIAFIMLALGLLGATLTL